jgi:ferric-dicitrate binding protein FerR (iron transport regulator)
MQDNEFDKLIDQYLKGHLSIDEKRKVDEWLHQMADHTAFDKLTKPEQDESENNIRQKLADRIKLAQKQTRPSLIVRLRPLLSVAAAVMLFGILIFVFSARLKEFFNIQQSASITNSSGHITKSILPDGSIVWLKGKSKLCYPVKFKGQLRNVYLEGEALFEVAKDAAHPFIIHCGALTTRVLGTSFNIKHTSNKIEVNVLTGRVFLSSTNSAAVTLHPYQKAVFSEVKKTIVQEKEPVVKVDELTAGTEYNMFFDDALVGDVLQRVEKKFEITITGKNSKINNSRITADLTDQSLSNTMNMICEALNLSFEINNKTVILTDKRNAQNKTLN